MSLFKIKNNDLLQLKHTPFELEKTLQEITENNLEKIFGLQFISTEFQVNNLRIDTLAYDPEVNAFVIIEYKRGRSFSVIDQGYAYLALMLNNKADFILEYNENKNQNLKRGSVDWSQSRVIFIAQSFTSHQKAAINFKDLPLELWSVKKYEGDLVDFEQIKPTKTTESIKTISHDQTVKKVSQEVKTYSIEDHFKEGWDQSRELFEELRERILELDERVEESPVKNYIGYKINNNVLFNLKSRKSKILVELYRVQPSDLKDPESEVKYRKNSMEYWNKHVSLFEVHSQDDVGYALFLIKQLYKKYADEF